MLRPAIQSLPNQLSSWQLPRLQTDAIVTDAMAITERDPLLSYNLLRSYLTGTDASASSETLRTSYLSLCLRLPQIFTFPTSDLPSSSAEVALANAISSGDVSSISSVPEKCGSQSSLATKARNVAIARLLANAVGSTVSYDDVREALSAGQAEDSDAEVEGWVIDGSFRSSSSLLVFDKGTPSHQSRSRFGSTFTTEATDLGPSSSIRQRRADGRVLCKRVENDPVAIDDVEGGARQDAHDGPGCGR